MFEVKELVSGYGQSEVLHGVSMQAAKGEIVTLLGRNGMGKTTLFKTLMGILPARKGEVRVDGAELSKLESFERVARGRYRLSPAGLDALAEYAFVADKD